jgi:hypothetical protein
MGPPLFYVRVRPRPASLPGHHILMVSLAAGWEACNPDKLLTTRNK